MRSDLLGADEVIVLESELDAWEMKGLRPANYAHGSDLFPLSDYVFDAWGKLVWNIVESVRSNVLTCAHRSILVDEGAIGGLVGGGIVIWWGGAAGCFSGEDVGSAVHILFEVLYRLTSKYSYKVMIKRININVSPCFWNSPKFFSQASLPSPPPIATSSTPWSVNPSW